MRMAFGFGRGLARYFTRSSLTFLLPVRMPVDQFSFRRQTIAFLGILAILEVAIVLVFPAASVLLGVLAVMLIVFVWIKAGIRTRKWLWWNPAAVPLTQMEGAIALSAVLFFSVGILVTGYEANRYASGERDLLTGYAFRHMLSSQPSSRPVGTRSSSYSDPAMQQRLKDELAKAGIPYALDVTDGKEFIKWSVEHNTAVEDIQRRKIDAMFSGGRNASFPDPALRQEFTDWLTRRGITYEVVKSSSGEFVVWDRGPNDLVRQFMEGRSTDCPPGAAASASGKAGQTRC
jgi:hypothetical protein